MTSAEIGTVAELGRQIRAGRRRVDLKQDELAALAGVGTRFLSELENGKATIEFGRVLRVLSALGLRLQVVNPSSPARRP